MSCSKDEFARGGPNPQELSAVIFQKACAKGHKTRSIRCTLPEYPSIDGTAWPLGPRLVYQQFSVSHKNLGISAISRLPFRKHQCENVPFNE